MIRRYHLLAYLIFSTYTTGCGLGESDIQPNSFEGWEQRIPQIVLRNRTAYLYHCRLYRSDCDDVLKIPIIIDSLARYGASETANGKCVRTSNIEFIVLSNKFYDSEYLLAHELGHCHLGQFHDNASSDYSLMSTSHCGMWVWESMAINGRNELYRELFTGEPFSGPLKCL